MKSPDRWIQAALLLIPLLLGFCFLAATSGHGDSALYRRFILELHHTGVLPLMRFEWYHPGHYLLVWPVFAIGAGLGCWDDPLHAIQLVNFLAHGVAAVLVYRLWQCLFPGADTIVALLPALTLATLPAWLWHSQEAMSDVAGAAFLVGVIWRLLAHDFRADTAWLPYLLTGFLAAWSFLMRGSTALFLPMMVFLVVRLLHRHPQVSRVRVLVSLLVGGLVPLVLVYGYLALVHSWETFYAGYFQMSDHNTKTTERLAELPGTIRTWGGNLLRGMGLGVFVALPGCVLLVVQQRLLLWLALLTLPYLAGVANNHAGFELRYMIPIMAAVVLGYGAIGAKLRRFGRWPVLLFLVVLLVLQAVQALPILDMLRSRQHFGEVAARQIVNVAPEGSLLIGVTAQPFLCLLRNGDRPMAVKTHAGTGGMDTWNRTWSVAKDVVTHHVQRGRGVYCSREPGMLGFLDWMRGQGFKEQVLATIPAKGLRDTYDQALSRGNPHAPVAEDPLRILRLVPPEQLDRLEVHLLPADGGTPGLRFRVEAPAHPGREYRIFVGKPTTRRLWLWHVDLPFDGDDRLYHTSIQLGDRPEYGVRGFRGRLDGDGVAEAFAPANLVDDGTGLTVVAVLFEDAANLDSACLASLPVGIK